jgi:hypothetical protein
MHLLSNNPSFFLGVLIKFSINIYLVVVYSFYAHIRGVFEVSCTYILFYFILCFSMTFAPPHPT